MTREEVMKGLKSLVEVRRKYGDMQTIKDEIECFEMAIKALKQEPVLNKIRDEIDQYLFQNEFGSEYRKEVLQIIDKYKAESEEQEWQ